MSIIKTKTKSSATYKGLLKRFLVEQLNIMEELGFINERSFEERQRDFENIKEKVSQILN